MGSWRNISHQSLLPMRAFPSVHAPWLPAWPWPPLCPNSAPFPFPGTIHGGTCSIAFPTQPVKSRSQICLAEPGALSVKTAASGRRWQPPQGKRGNLEDRTSVQVCLAEGYSIAQALPERRLCPSDYSEPTHGFLSPVQWTQTPCELQSLWCSGLHCSFCVYYMLEGKDASGPSTPLPPRSLRLLFGAWHQALLSSHSLHQAHTCAHTCASTQYYRALGQTVVSSGCLLKASHPR